MLRKDAKTSSGFALVVVTLATGSLGGCDGEGGSGTGGGGSGGGEMSGASSASSASSSSSSSSASSSSSGGGSQCTTDAECAPFEDGDLCNGTLHCVEGSCQLDPSSVVVCDESGDTACMATKCEPQTGQCAPSNMPDGTPCNDGLYCTTQSACLGGKCVGSGSPCFIACQVCDESKFACVPAPGNCYIEGSCYAAYDKSPYTQCKHCDPKAPDVWSNVAAGAACDINDTCYVADACDGQGYCLGAVPKTPPVPQPWTPMRGARTGSVWSAPTLASVLRPVFRWRHVSDGCVPPSSYDIQIDDSCTGDVQACSFPSPEVDKNLDTTKYQPDFDLPVSTAAPVGRRYFWRVRAWRGAVASPWSPVYYVDVGRVGGDLNGDGHSDVALGSPSDDLPKVYIHYGSASGIAQQPDLVLTTPDAYAYGQFGRRMIRVDLNGDGFDELAVNAPLAQPGGKLHVYPGSAAGIPDAPALTLQSPAPAISTPWGFADFMAAAHFNGDGYEDLAATPHEVMSPPFMHVFAGASSLSSVAATMNVPAPQNLGDGTERPAAVDINGDASPDLIVAVEHPVAGLGKLAFFAGSLTGVAATPAKIVSAPPATTHFFAGTIAVGDVNGDAHADVILGDEGATNTMVAKGGLFAYHGATTWAPASPSAARYSPVNDSVSFARDVDAGDVDGDGFIDVVVGAPRHPGQTSQEGHIYLYRGGSSGLSQAPASEVHLPMQVQNAHFGWPVAVVGDVNGDGRADVIAGAPYINGGAAFVFLGAPAGLPSMPALTLFEPSGPGNWGFGQHIAN